MDSPNFTQKQWVMLAMPIALLFTMLAAFQGFVALHGYPLGYLVAFLIYWIGWCIALPMLVLGGPREIIKLFQEPESRFGDRPWLTLMLLWWPVALPIAFVLPLRLSDLTVSIVVVSILLGIVTGVTEEILWRGVYVKLFPNSIWLKYVYPSVGFALWHIAPQSVRPVSLLPPHVALVAFVFVSLLLGLSWGYYAQKTGSIRWCTIAHVINDAFGFGAFAYIVWLS